MRVVLAGGGVAGLEAALALRELAGESVDLDWLAPEPLYWYRPLAVAEPFGIGLVQRLDLGRMAAAVGAAFMIGELARVDRERRCAETAAGARLEYDALVIACGARPEPVVTGALTFRGPADCEPFRGLLAELESGAASSLAFAVPAGAAWPLPVYELALLTSAFLASRGIDGRRLALVTPEAAPLHAFGPQASAAVQLLLAERGIEFHGRTEPLGIEDCRLATRQGELAADRVVALPRLRGPAIAGVPHDADGFIPVDGHGRVHGADCVYAAGDATSFPVKLGAVAAQQADAIAESIASHAGAAIIPQPVDPVLRGVILTGAVPRYLQTPLRGGDAEVAVEPLWWPPTKIAARRLGPFLEGPDAAPSGAVAPVPVELEISRAPAATARP